MFTQISKFLEKYFLFIRSRIPKQPEESCVGLDIGARSCKAVEMILSSSGVFKIVNWAVEPVDGEDVESSIRKILSRFGFSSKNIFTGLSGQGILIRFIKMPRMPLKQLRQSLSLETDKYFPFSKDQIFMDCHIVEDNKGKDSKVLVLVAVAKNEIVKKRIDFITSLGFQSNCIGLNAVALSNAFIKLQKNKKDGQSSQDPSLSTVAVLDIGEIKSSLVILDKNTPKFTRDISVGGKDFTQKIVNVFGVDLVQAEAIRQNPGVKSDEMLSACQSTLSSLVSEIRLSFDYFTSENSLEVTRLYLTGDSSYLPKIEDFFMKELGIPAERWNPVDALDFSDKVSRESFSENIHQLPVALGLSLCDDD
ncbi:MAG: type IV pilus assembly protein PilM [Candidatus Omnitrophica bacterium]|nr:type IV pilus assembly protein PilM [Candidatus Omnitrophota bacterium]